jgi:hypothetical protein
MEPLLAHARSDGPDLNIRDRYWHSGTNRPAPAFRGTGSGVYRMLDGFTKRDFAIFAAALFVAGALTVGAVDFVIYHYVFQDTGAAPILAK